MISSTDAWAVGSTASGSGLYPCPEGPPQLGQPRALIEHWDGRAWTIVENPAPQPTANAGGTALDAVSGSGPNDVWAIGNRLIEHWDGASWRIVPSLIDTSELDAVEAISPTDAWAAGQGGNGNFDTTLIEHWDGHRWQRAPSPSVNSTAPYDHNVLHGLSAIGPTNVWAVGQVYEAYPDGSGPTKTLVEHWDGHRWRIVPSPNFSYPGSSGRSELNSVLAISPTDVWAVGERDKNCCGALLTLIEHWDGKSWQIVPSPNPGGDEGLVGLAARSPNDIFAVGNGVAGTLVEHWNGTRWTVTPSPNVPTVGNELSSVAAANTGEMWAVGSTPYLEARRQSLIVQLQG